MSIDYAQMSKDMLWSLDTAEYSKFSKTPGVIVRYAERPATENLIGLIGHLRGSTGADNLTLDGRPLEGTWETVKVYVRLVGNDAQGSARMRRIFHAIRLVNAGVDNSVTIETQKNCSFKVTYTPYYRVANVDIPSATSGVEYSVNSLSKDDDTGAWSYLLEKREQLTVALPVHVTSETRYIKVEERAYTGVRTDDKDHTGAAVTLWNPDTEGVHVLVETTRSKNANCTTDIRQRRITSTFIEDAEYEKFEDAFNIIETWTDRNAEATENIVYAGNGITKRLSSTKNDDETYTLRFQFTTYKAVSAAVKVTRKTLFAENASVVDRNQDTAGDEGVAVSGGIITRTRNEKGAAGKIDVETETEKELAVSAALKRTTATAFEKLEEVRDVGQAEPVAAVTAVTVPGVLVEATSEKSNAGLANNTTRTRTAIEQTDAGVEETPGALVSVKRTQKVNTAKPSSTAVAVAGGKRVTTRYDLNDYDKHNVVIIEETEHTFSDLHVARADALGTDTETNGVAATLEELEIEQEDGVEKQLKARRTNNGRYAFTLREHVPVNDESGDGQRFVLLNFVGYTGAAQDPLIQRRKRVILYMGVSMERIKADVAQFLAKCAGWVSSGSLTVRYWYDTNVNYSVNVDGTGKWTGHVLFTSELREGFVVNWSNDTDEDFSLPSP